MEEESLIPKLGEDLVVVPVHVTWNGETSQVNMLSEDERTRGRVVIWTGDNGGMKYPWGSQRWTCRWCWGACCLSCRDTSALCCHSRTDSLPTLKTQTQRTKQGWKKSQIIPTMLCFAPLKLLNNDVAKRGDWEIKTHLIHLHFPRFPLSQSPLMMTSSGDPTNSSYKCVLSCEVKCVYFLLKMWICDPTNSSKSSISGPWMRRLNDIECLATLSSSNWE